ncbi:Intermembrane phospholipid transport system binding protein MlaD [Gammaproteobacteria bacterium]|nr:Intermembrane phospholipid transport system binding protein MlaD [Gammaproteobacteria bacterium]
MQQSRVVETWVGLFVASGMLALFFLAMKVSNLGELQTDKNSFRLTARFQNAGSLKERSPVSMAGVRIGRVSAIRFDKETYEAVVEMRIEPQYNTLPSDTTASILTAGLLGEQYVGLSAGGSSDYLKEGDKIEMTQSALVLEEIISRFLFNKAEGGSDKKVSSSSATEGDAEPATAIPEAVPEKTKPPVKSVEPVPSPVKPKAESGEGKDKPVQKPKATRGKGDLEGHAETKAKPAQGKGGEVPASANKTKK